MSRIKQWSIYAPVVITVSALSATLGTWASIAAGSICWKVFLASLLIIGQCVWLGACILTYLEHDRQKLNPIVAVLAGYFCTSIFLFVGTVILHLSILVSNLTCVAALVLLTYRTRKKPPLSRLCLDPLDASSLLVVILFATLWSQQNLQGVALSKDVATSTPWMDVLYHSIHISHFANGSGKVLGTDPFLALAPLAPYHYAGYLVPSLLVRTTGIAAYVATVAVFSPLGTLFASLSAYAIGRVLVGPLGGLIAVVLCIAIPDPTFYLLENRWVSYFFFQQIASNGALGAALMGLGWAFCIQGVIEQRRRLTFAGLAAGLFVVIFKSQIFLTYSFGLLLFAASTFPRLTPRVRVVFGLLVSGVFAVCAGVILPAIPHAPSFSPGTTAGPLNLHFALSNIGGHFQACVPELSKHFPLFLAIAIPAFLLFVFGPLTPTFLVLSTSKRIRNSLGPAGIWFLWTAVASYLFITLGLEANTTYGDAFEISHKTFVWPYLAVATWCGCALAAWIRDRTWITQRILLVVGLPAVLAGLAPYVHDCANNLQTGFVYVGSETTSHIKLPRDLYNVALFLRNRTPKPALIQLGAKGSSILFEALAERRTFVTYVASGRNAPESAVLANAKLAAMLAATTPEAFRNLARECHIDYFVLYAGQRTAWDTSIQPVFTSGDVRVYRI